MNGSSTVPSVGHPALIQSMIRCSGKTAKWAPLNGLVVTAQTDRLLAFNPSHGTDEQTFDPVPSGHPLSFPFFRCLLPDLRRPPLVSLTSPVFPLSKVDPFQLAFILPFVFPGTR